MECSHQIRMGYTYGIQPPNKDGLYVWNSATKLGWVIYMECSYRIILDYRYIEDSHQLKLNYDHHHDLVDRYVMSVSQMTTDMFLLS